MGDAKKLALIGMTVLLIYTLWHSSPAREQGAEEPTRRQEEQSAEHDSAADRPYEVSVIRVPAAASEDWEETMFSPSGADTAVEMTIGNTAAIKNETAYPIDSSEAYTPAGLDRYEPSDTTRTEDREHNIIRVGDELARLLEEAGLQVIHDRGVYDYPSYTGSYGRSGAAVEQYLRDYPSIRVVLDVHRDALGADGVIYKTVAEEAGTCASQAMLLVGTDESGLDHPAWRENLAFGLYLQNAVVRAHPTLMRPLAVVPQRYNQQLCPGMLILEVGSSGNTMQEALSAVRLFAEGAAPALAALVEQGEFTDN